MSLLGALEDISLAKEESAFPGSFGQPSKPMVSAAGRRLEQIKLQKEQEAEREAMTPDVPMNTTARRKSAHINFMEQVATDFEVDVKVICARPTPSPLLSVCLTVFAPYCI